MVDIASGTLGLDSNGIAGIRAQADTMAQLGLGSKSADYTPAGANDKSPRSGSYADVIQSNKENEAERLGITPEEVDIIGDIKIMIDEMQANRSAGSGNELEAALVSSIIAKLPPGTTSKAANVIMLEAERRDRMDGGRTFDNDVWDRARKDVEEKRKAQSETDEFADKMDDIAQQRQAEIARQEAYWSNRDVQYDGMTLKGDEWKRMAMIMRSDEFRRMMRERGAAKGYSDKQMDEAEKLAPAIADSLARGKKPSPELDAAYKSNPALRDYVRAAQDRVVSARPVAEIKAETVASSSTTAVQSGQASVVDGTNFLDKSATTKSVAMMRDDAIGARAPDATASFNTAATGTSTAASPVLQPNRVAELKVAAIAPPAADQTMGI